MTDRSETEQGPTPGTRPVSELTGSTGFLVNFKSLFRHGKVLGDESEAPNFSSIVNALHIGHQNPR